MDVNGNWSYTTAGQASRRSVSGTVAATGFHQGGGPPFNNYLHLKTAVTTGTDDGIATSGGYLGSWVTVLPQLDIQQHVLDPLQGRALGGACVQIVTNADKVHVIPGGTVAIVAHLTDSDGIATFAGPITAYNGASRVTPTTAQANTNSYATFTYSAPTTAHAGDTDVVQLSHISRRGKARDGTVTVIVDKSPYPARFAGTWTSVFTTPNGSQGWTETVHGTASYVRDPASPHVEAGQSYVDYTPQSGSVDWTVSGSSNPSGQCLNTFSGSGTAQATGDVPVTSQLTLEDVRNNPFGPNPEAQPYYYSIAATGDGANPPPYDDTHTPAGCASDSQGATAVDYLGIGWPNNYGPNAPPDQVQKTSDPTQLQGHYTGPDSTGIFQVDTTWSFTGSG